MFSRLEFDRIQLSLTSKRLWALIQLPPATNDDLAPIDRIAAAPSLSSMPIGGSSSVRPLCESIPFSTPLRIPLAQATTPPSSFPVQGTRALQSWSSGLRAESIGFLSQDNTPTWVSQLMTTMAAMNNTLATLATAMAQPSTASAKESTGDQPSGPVPSEMAQPSTVAVTESTNASPSGLVPNGMAQPSTVTIAKTTPGQPSGLAQQPPKISVSPMEHARPPAVQQIQLPQDLQPIYHLRGGENFMTWKDHLTSQLQCRNLSAFVFGSKRCPNAEPNGVCNCDLYSVNYHISNRAVLGYLRRQIHGSLLPIIRHYISASTLMDFLESEYGNSHFALRGTIKMNLNDDLDNWSIHSIPMQNSLTSSSMKSIDFGANSSTSEMQQMSLTYHWVSESRGSFPMTLLKRKCYGEK